MPAGSYFPNYYSLEDIIVTQEKVPCIVDANLVGMGKISVCIVRRFVGKKPLKLPF